MTNTVKTNKTNKKLLKALNKVIADLEIKDVSEEEYEHQMEEVVELLNKKYGDSIVDYNVAADNRVELLDAEDKVVHVINSDELTKYWNMVE